MDQQISRALKILGIALTIPSVLVCGPVLGYLIAAALINKGAPQFLMPLLLAAGTILAFVQTFRTVKLLLEIEKKS